MGEDPWPWTLGNVCISNWEFVSGNKFDPGRKLPHLHVPVTSTGLQLDFSQAGHAGVPIVSARAVNVLGHFANLASVPVEVTSLDAQILEKYFILIIEEKRAALDVENSRVKFFDKNDRIRPDLAGQIKSSYELRVDSTRTAGMPIFRLAEGSNHIFVSDAFKRKVEDARLTGFQFVDA